MFNNSPVHYHISTGRKLVIYMRNDRYTGIPNYESWWNVPVAEVSEMAQVEYARAEWAAMQKHTLPGVSSKGR